jgi:small conductance mechanosensitive channel
MNEFVRGVMGRLRAELDPARMGAATADFLSDLVVGALTFLVFYLAWRVLNTALRAVLARADADRTTAQFVETALKYAVLTFGVVQALAAVGINTGALIASLGLAGLTIGFAARDALSNLISGILIFWDRPFVIGDLVEVEGEYGRVDRITLRSTRVVTPDGRMLAVPNSTVINSTVASYTNFPNLRLDVEVTVGVGEQIEAVRRTLLGIVHGDPRFMHEPAPRVVVTALGDYNVTLELQAWLKNEREHKAERFALRERMFDALTAAGVDMPFETIQLAPVEARVTSAGEAAGDGAATGAPNAGAA